MVLKQDETDKLEKVEKEIIEEPTTLEIALEINEAITENMKQLLSDLILEVRDSQNYIIGYAQFTDVTTLKKNVSDQKKKLAESSIELKPLHKFLLQTIKPKTEIKKKE